MLTSAAGIGYLVTRNRTILDSPRVFAAILMILVLSVLFDMLARAVERRMVVWQSAGRRPRRSRATTRGRTRRRTRLIRRLRRSARPAGAARHGLSTVLPTTVVGSYPAARLAGEPRDAVEDGAAHAHEGHLARRRDASSSRRRTTPPCSPSATWSAPASTSSPTARSGARATPTASPPRSKASTSTSPGQVTRASGGMTPVPRVVGKIRRSRPGRGARHGVPAPATPTAPAKITLPGPFTMSQQAKNEFYNDAEEMVMDFAVAVNEEARDLRSRRRRHHPARRAVAAQRPRGRQALRRQGDQPRARGHHRARPSCICASAMPRWCRARPSRSAIRSCRSLRTATPSRSRSRPRSRSSISAC